jgi:hypothetical protein
MYTIIQETLLQIVEKLEKRIKDEMVKIINQLYNVDRLEMVCSTVKSSVPLMTEGLKEISVNRLSNRAFESAFTNGEYIIGTGCKFSNDDREIVKVIIENKPLYVNDFVTIIENLMNKYNLRIDDVNLHICLDSDTDLFGLVDYIITNDDEYKWTGGTPRSVNQEGYREIIVGSDQDFYFVIYNKSKELRRSKKEYISQIHKDAFKTPAPIYRIELRLKPKHCKKSGLNVLLLNDKGYLKQIFKTYYYQRFSYKIVNPTDSNTARWPEEYPFDIEGPTCISEIRPYLSDISSEQPKGTNHMKTLLKGYYNLYKLHGDSCYLDSIVKTCFYYYDLKKYANKIVKDEGILTLINNDVENEFDSLF